MKQIALKITSIELNDNFVILKNAFNSFPIGKNNPAKSIIEENPKEFLNKIMVIGYKDITKNGQYIFPVILNSKQLPQQIKYNY